VTVAGDVDVVRLERRLSAEVSGGARFDPSTRALFAADASNYRITPLGVVFPATTDEIVATLGACREAGVPVVPRGSGTSIAGQAVGPGVVIDCSRHLDRILEIDPSSRSARVEPGVVLDDLQRAVARFGLRFGPDPSTHNRATLGGMIGNNACGSHSLRYGKTDVNVARLSIATYDGARLELGQVGGTQGTEDRARSLDGAIGDLLDRSGETIRHLARPGLRRQVSGYALGHLLPENGGRLASAFVGTEGTCGVVLDATVHLVAAPVATALVVVGFADAFVAADAVPEFVAVAPLTVEGIDRRIVDLASRRRRARIDLPSGDAFLLVEVEGASEPDALERARALTRELGAPGRSFAVLVGEEASEAWRIRDDGAGLATRLADGTEAWPGFEDAAVAPEHLGGYLRAFDALLTKHGLGGIPYGHFGEGCVHIRIDFDLLSRPGIARYRSFMEQAASLVSSFGGSLSGEHGDGQARGELLRSIYPPEALDAFASFKRAFDPDGGMNPGRGVHPRPLDEDLRVFDLLPTAPSSTAVALRGDGRDLAAASRRCVGVGACRRLDAGAMCPSFQVTRDEAHSTRGRARLIGEMLGGTLSEEGWRSEAVRDALDLCLGCKACRIECPVGVDMATYRVEFLAQHYRWRRRPRSHYAFGFLPLVVRLGSLVPRRANALVDHPVAGRILRRLAGVAPTATIPHFSVSSSRSARLRACSSSGGGSGVVRFADCFTQFVDTEVAEAAEEVLDRLDIDTDVVGGNCCGLTFFSTGQLGLARSLLRRSVAALRRSGSGPVLVLEPSCAAMLRDEATALLGEDVTDVSARVVSLAELIVPMGLDGRGTIAESIVAQIHCHAYAGDAYERELEGIAALGGSIAAVETRCCGLAGNFGLEAGHEEIAEQIARRNIVSTLEAHPTAQVVMADGFSCRSQIAAVAGRESAHFAEIVRDALGARTAPRDDRSQPDG
jgi:FAD/FMN-containing dehydrogenase/Fe-S oxidoreductase